MSIGRRVRKEDLMDITSTASPEPDPAVLSTIPGAIPGISRDQQQINLVKQLVESLKPPGILETATGIVTLIAWAGFFGAGVLVYTKGYRDKLWNGDPMTAAQWIRASVVTFCCYTVTNLFFLACLASYL